MDSFFFSEDPMNFTCVRVIVKNEPRNEKIVFSVFLTGYDLHQPAQLEF